MPIASTPPFAADHGEPLFDVCDAHSQEMQHIYSLLYGPDEGHFKEAIAKRFHAVEPDCLVLDYVILHPKWRGLRLGLLAARKDGRPSRWRLRIGRSPTSRLLAERRPRYVASAKVVVASTGDEGGSSGSSRETAAVLPADGVRENRPQFVLRIVDGPQDADLG